MDPTLDELIEAFERWLGTDVTATEIKVTRREGTLLLDQLRRLKEYDETEARFDRGRPGASVTDCIGWIYLQKRNAEAGRDTAANMESRMFAAVIAHLEELHGRRAGADRAKAAERERREKEYRERREKERAKAQQDEAQRERARTRNEQSNGSWYYEQARKRYEEPFRDFSNAEEMWREFYSAGFTGFRQQSESNRSRRPNPPPGSGSKWYEVLGVSASATEADIKKAYRRLAAKFHPDRPGGSHEKMREINVARDAGLSGLRA